MNWACWRIYIFISATVLFSAWMIPDAYKLSIRSIPAIPQGGWPEDDYIGLIRVIDGDTLKVWYHGKETDVRLLNINTPERGKPGYWESTESLKELLTCKRLRIEFEGNRHGKFGRLLGYVFADSINVNVEQVKRGHSKYWTKYGRSKKYEREFKNE